MNRTFFCISIIAVALFACTPPAPPAVSADAKTTDLVVNPDALIQMDVSVEGMTCTGCENTINTGVAEIAGVVEVKSSFQEGKTIVKFDSTQTNIEKISEAITEKGYSVKGYMAHAEIEEPAAVQ
jgi:mercuric ion transport protein